MGNRIEMKWDFTGFVMVVAKHVAQLHVDNGDNARTRKYLKAVSEDVLRCLDYEAETASRLYETYGAIQLDLKEVALEAECLDEAVEYSAPFHLTNLLGDLANDAVIPRKASDEFADGLVADVEFIRLFEWTVKTPPTTTGGMGKGTRIATGKVKETK